MGRKAAKPQAETPEIPLAVRIDGELTVWRVGELRDTMTSALAPRAAIVVDLTGVGAADAAGLQLLCAAHRSAAERGVALRILAGPVVTEAIDRAGLCRDAGCRAGCLWAGET